MQRWPKAIVLSLIALCGLAAVVAVLHWWPNSQRDDQLRGLIPFAAPGYTLVHAQLLTVVPACTGVKTVDPSTCGESRVRILDGSSAGRIVRITLSPDVAKTGLAPGDGVLLFDGTRAAKPDTTGIAGAETAFPDFSFYRADRSGPMLLLAALFAIAVIAVAGRQGFMALVSLAVAGVAVLGYLIPALLSGQPAVPVTLATSTLILIVMLYLTHGLSMRTSVALAGALVGIGLSTAFASAGIIGARLGGVGDESAGLLNNNVAWISVQQLIVASVVLAGVGTLNDVTVTQASALWELRGAAPGMSRWELFRSAMRIGRDHVASTVYTLVFAYLGTALVLLVAVQLYGGGAADFVTAENVAEEVVRALVGGVALVLAMPITTAIGTLVVATADPRIRAEPPTEESSRFPRASGQQVDHSKPSRDELRRLPDDPW